MKGPPFDIAFITDGEEFHGASPEERALGGSETALVQVARALVRQGHRVRVYCRCPRPGQYQGVDYHDRKDLVEAATRERFEVLVVSRFFTAFDLPIQAGLKVLWNHDILDQPQLMARRLDQMDLALVLSRFHAANYVQRLPECQPKLELTRNGLDLDLLDRAAAGVARVPGRLTYVSRPERGLKDLLQHIWPRLKASLPHLELKLCGYSVDAASLHPALQAEYDHIRELIASAPGVEDLGPLAKQDYYAHLASCEAILYPCVFPEISCITALEAQALGTAIITSDAFALSESVQEPFFKVVGQPGSRQYLESFVDRASRFLLAPQKYGALLDQARQKVRASYSWQSIAAEWADIFERKLEERDLNQPLKVAASLLMEGDARAAGMLLDMPVPLPAEGPAPPDPQEDELNREISLLSLEVLPAQGGRVALLAHNAAGCLSALRVGLGGRDLQALGPGQSAPADFDLLIIRDLLERETQPQRLLDLALSLLKPGGWLLLCIANGAWPMLSSGFMGRQNALGPGELQALLPGRKLRSQYLPRALVKTSGQPYPVGRWLILAPKEGPEPQPLDITYKTRQVRPAPPEVVRALQTAGIITSTPNG